MNKGFFGSLFDLNRDGKLDFFERTMDIMAFNDLLEGEENNDEWDEDEDDDF